MTAALMVAGSQIPPRPFHKTLHGACVDFFNKHKAGRGAHHARGESNAEAGHVAGAAHGPARGILRRVLLDPLPRRRELPSGASERGDRRCSTWHSDLEKCASVVTLARLSNKTADVCRALH